MCDNADDDGTAARGMIPMFRQCFAGDTKYGYSLCDVTVTLKQPKNGNIFLRK